ncbi:L(+)-tartrate dehydratase subunit alpha [Actinomyces sp. oral taxon 448 str. F0400]|nr:fumarate hydratase [Actinomyces sp. oral taxon 448]EGQ75151.1 L(+)-tartrate dehydratase subunit alpha [Actinomyces sp. oral taxon 448 str. F0400]
MTATPAAGTTDATQDTSIPTLSATAPGAAGLAELADVVARFTAVISRRLPDDVTARLKELAEEETNPMATMIYRTMQRNQSLALELKRPSCQDTGLVQIFATVGSHFPCTDGLAEALKAAIAEATRLAPLRHNTVETFDEYNTGTNIGTKSPWIYWDVAEGRDDLTLHVYLAGGGCTLPGQGRTLMPGEGYEAAMKFVLDVMTSTGSMPARRCWSGWASARPSTLRATCPSWPSCGRSTRMRPTRRSPSWRPTCRRPSTPSAWGRRGWAGPARPWASTSRTPPATPRCYRSPSTPAAGRTAAAPFISIMT